ncbi:kisspeptin 2 [Nothobranchius furzeri]|uniref:Kisspeptin 2 n=1 Tax=Nothobranchius furzeri TaxID=105023 RepID=A0A8C6LX46_NOTFU
MVRRPPCWYMLESGLTPLVKMQLVALVVVCVLVVGEDGGTTGLDFALKTPAPGEVPAAFRRRNAGDLEDDPSLCFSLRENEDQRQLLCNDRRSKFNYNPFGLRFGKRYPYRRALRRARTNRLLPLSVFSRELEVPT